eukprot:TRINITY_DN3736_c0_g1_i1.p1 TRINITY_DN3736_c0_g1~~TRINITY_DN3736_c0_g1_i1.p1  ORF type:complete len:365 (+),score=66.29 TRINITY_DN3736_c0_g1_i1:96-1190(+)
MSSTQSRPTVATPEFLVADSTDSKQTQIVSHNNAAAADIGKVNWKDISPLRLAALTWATSAIEVGLTYPTWVMKTRQQIQNGSANTTSRSALTEAWRSSGRSIGSVTRTFYRGYGTYATLAMPAYVIYSGAYTWSKSELGFVSGSTDVSASNMLVAFSPLAAGLFADVLCLTTYVPVELVTQKLQVSPSKTTARQIARDIYSRNGLIGFYKGFGATVITSGVSSGLIWLTYEHAKKVLQRSAESLPGYENRQSVLNAASAMLAGSTAMVVANVLSNPLDVVKTRIQVSNQTGGFSEGLRALFRKEGVRGAFTRGIGPKVCSAIPLGAISSLTYEAVLYFSRKDVMLSSQKNAGTLTKSKEDYLL